MSIRNYTSEIGQPQVIAKDASRLRILLVGPIPPPMGGITRYAQDLAGSELSRLHEITLFPDNIPFQWRPHSKTEGFKWNIVRRDGLWTSTKVLSFVVRRMAALDRTLRLSRFDLMHVLSSAGYGFFRNAIHILIARMRGTRTVFHLLGQIDDMYRDAGPDLKRLISLCLDMANVHIVQSPMLANRVRAMTRRPVYSIINGVPVDELSPQQGFSHSPGHRIRVICLGVLGNRKGTLDLLHAAVRTMDADPPFDFIFVGAGAIDHFRGIAAQMSIADRVHFLGPVEDAVRISLLQTSDIFALPSKAEGLPIALLEALAAGLPVIASKVGAIPEVVHKDNGFLIDPGDVDALVRCLKALSTDATLRERFGRFNAQEAREKYPVQRVIRQIHSTYLSAIRSDHSCST